MHWLHLSDIHSGRPSEARTNALRQLVEAIDNNAQGSLDFVILTGDLAYSGLPNEYADVLSELIDPLRNIQCTRDAEFIAVPGNHDLDCDCAHPITWSGIGKQRQQKFWDTDEEGNSLRLARARGFEAYANFLQSSNIHGPDPTREPGSRIELPLQDGTQATFIGLNTALFSDKQLTDEEEKGTAPLPVQTLRSLSKDIPRGPVFVLGHHPVDWFENQSRRQFITALQEIGAVYLHGHAHEILPHFGSHSLVALGFGAAYPQHIDVQEPPYTSTFALCTLDNELHIKFVSWEPTYGTWRPNQAVPIDFNQQSDVLSGGYAVPVPTTRSATLQRTSPTSRATTKIELGSPVWISGDQITEWAALLESIGLIRSNYSIINQPTRPQPAGQANFFVRDSSGQHGVRAFAAETTVITYEHVESVNTEIDTLSLDSYIVATFGNVSTRATQLANNLRQRKRITVLDGGQIASRLANTKRVRAFLTDPRHDRSEFFATPLVVDDGIAYLLQTLPTQDSYAVANKEGETVPEHDALATDVRKTLPELDSKSYRSLGFNAFPPMRHKPRAFDRSDYLKRSFAVFDTANYAGLAAVGVHLPVESLRQIYVPTSANVEQDRTAIEATNRAIDDLVEALGLDETQKIQLARQMKSTYGVRSTSEVDAASELYQSLSNVVVLGDPGSGKSCFVRAQILSYCEPPNDDEGNWYRQHIPVFLPLAEYSSSLDEGSSLVDHCVDHAQSQQFGLDRNQLDIMLSRGRVALFLDGLDEIGSIATRQRVVADLAELIREFAPRGNRFVLTSRPAAVRDLQLPSELTSVSLLGLTDLEIEVLATKLLQTKYGNDNPLPEQDQDVVNAILRDCQLKPGIRRLARNPLLLTLLVFIYENSGPFAARRHLIYSHAVRTLVSVRHRAILRARLSEADLRTRLGKLAISIFRRRTGPLPSRKEVGEILIQQLDMEELAAESFIQKVAEITGLLRIHPRTSEKQNDLVSFMHHSFLEYYTALGFIEDESNMEDAFSLALTARWYEIVTLMFGIMDEHIDVTPKIRGLCEYGNSLDSVTAQRLELALDCALECDVPPEATQRYLADQVAKMMSSGAGRHVSEVRETLATKISALLENSQSQPMESLLHNGIASDDPELAAAYVHLVSKIGRYANNSSDLLASLSAAVARQEPPIRLAVINAMRELPALRSDENLDDLRLAITRGGVVERTAALQLLEEEPKLVPSFRDVVIDVLLRGGNPLSQIAANCVLRGGLFEDHGSVNQSLLDSALRSLMQHERPRQSLVGRLEIPWDEIETLIYSDSVTNRTRGFRFLVAVEEDAVKVHRILFDSLRTERHESVLESILGALSSYPAAIRTASLADTDVVCRLTKSRHQNVRMAAAMALRSFASLGTVIASLKERFGELKGIDSREADEVTKSLASHAVDDESCGFELVQQLAEVLHRQNTRWNKNQIGFVTRLLLACDQAGVVVGPSLAHRLFEIASDFRTPIQIRRYAMRFYGQACPTNADSANNIMDKFRVTDSDMRLAAYRATERFLGRCRYRVETVQAVRDSLLHMREALIKRWHVETRLVIDKLDSAPLREIRGCLLDIQSILGSYDEFADRIRADSIADPAKSNHSLTLGS